MIAYEDNRFYLALTHSSIQNFVNYYKTQVTNFNLSNLKWGYIDFSTVDLCDSNINHSIFYKCDFSGVSLENVRCVNTRFVDCDFSGAIGIDTHFFMCHFQDCKLAGVKFIGMVGTQSTFQKCSFKGAFIATTPEAFRGAKLKGCSFVLAHIPRGWLKVGSPIQGRRLLLGAKPTDLEDIEDIKEGIAKKIEEKKKIHDTTIRNDTY